MSSQSPESAYAHGGKTCAEVHGDMPHVFWAIDARRKREARAAIFVGLFLIVGGMGLAVLVSSQVVAWMMVVPGLLLLTIKGRPVRGSFKSSKRGEDDE
jgi:hypothetical protein